jgi:dTDP-4-amino-4,6-dideoxygalactose transaminase
MKVPFLDLKAQYESIRDEIAPALQRVLEATAFAGGPFVEQFEKEFAAFCHCQHAIGASSGTDALVLALAALDIGPGDEVITVPNTFVATVEAIYLRGAKPVLVDVSADTYNMNPALLEAAITPRTKALIPVHLFGQMADMDPIMDIAGSHGLVVIEDACQAHGAEYKGRPAASIGTAGCFSFYPGKNLGAYGEAGCVVTNNAELAEKIRKLRDHGQSKKYYHDLIGWNGRMDGIQGAVLSVKLKHIEDWNQKRRQHAALYNELLKGQDKLITPVQANYAKHVYHIYALRTPARDQLVSYLAESEIYCGIHYPVPIHRQKAYRFLGLQKGDYPVSEQCAAEFVSLPMFPELTGAQIERVVESIEKFLHKAEVLHV